MGDGKFLKALHIVGKGVLIPLLYEDPTYIAYPRLQILSTLTPTPTTSLSPAIPATTVFSVVLFLWLNE